jgi:hypothetical protein
MLTSTASCYLATSHDERDHVYRLRYECYHRRGAIPSSPAQRFSDLYDALPNHFSFLVSGEEEGPIGTVRISVARPDLGWNGSPASAVFGDHEAFQNIARGPYVEASRLCFKPQARRDVLYRLLANMTALAELHQAEWLVACPRVEHSPMYQRLFAFRPLAAPRQYFGVNFQTELLGVPLAEIRAVAAKVRSISKAWNEARALSLDDLGRNGVSFP